jgi:RNA polymerase sigma-70 factor (ECF subfamily)
MPAPDRLVEGTDERERVRAAIDQLGERERQLLLLRAEGYGYRELAAALDLHEASVGTLLARAKRAFREAYEGIADAP